MSLNLRTLFTIILVSLAIGPIVLVAVVSGRTSLVAVEDLERENLQSTVASVAQSVEAFFQVPNRELNALINITEITSQEPSKQKFILTAQLISNEVYQSISLTNVKTEKQVYVARSGVQSHEGMNQTVQAWERFGAQNADGAQFSKLRFDEHLQEPLITATLPVVDPVSGRVTHFLQADLRFKVIWELLAGLNLSQNKDAYVTDAGGRVIAHANPSVVLQNTAIQHGPDPQSRGLSGDWVTVMVRSIWLGEEQLRIYVEQPIAEAEAIQKRVLKAISLISGLVVLISFGLIFYFTKRIVEPVENLAEYIDELSHGRFPHNIATTGFGEIGVLAKTFDEMVMKLKIAQERLEAENRKLQQAERKSHESSRAKSEFLSSMSHELRTPLNAILGFAQVLELNHSEPLSDNQKKATSQIIKAGDHLLDLINDVLNLAKIEDGRLELAIEPVDTLEVVEDCISLINTLPQTKNITIDMDEFHGAVIRADRVRFKQVVFNLISNAVKYNRVPGKVSVSSAQIDGARHRIAITDTGHGIPENKRAQLFMPFSRLGAETSNIEGTGIGLVISKRLVEAMGGDIGFESTEGQGSTFWVDWPLDVDDEDVTGESDDAQAQHDLSNHVAEGRILYVEDSPASAALMAAVLENVPRIQLDIANTAEIGIAQAIRTQPNLILMDIGLPGMSGIEAMEELKLHDETRDIPVVALSADAMPTEVERGLEAGFKAYLTKPFNVPDLVKMVVQYVNADSKT